jgi:exopolyphosphatase/guanosine-5'-triphosphate,3'-diphosphate pyrophosphatase
LMQLARVLVRAMTGAPVRMGRVRVAVVDVGANTLRLLVADGESGSLEPVREERKRTALGEDVERLGSLSEAKIESSASAARKEVRRARKLGAARIAVVVTSPGRDASNGDRLVAALTSATGVQARLLSAEEEAALGFAGALMCTPVAAFTVAVCDVGGGSTQVAVGKREHPTWVRSFELGSLRLAQRCLQHDPPRANELERARAEAAAVFSDLTPPLPEEALATGGSARALKRFDLNRLDETSLATAVDELAARSAAEVQKRLGIEFERARTLPAGAIILAEVQRRLGVPLTVARGGVREGVCGELLAAEAAAKTA